YLGSYTTCCATAYLAGAHETEEIEIMRCRGYRTIQWAAVCWVPWIMLVCVTRVAAQVPTHTIAVLTSGQSFDPVLQGLRDGLARAGYEEGKQLTFIIEDTQGVVADLAERAVRLVAATPAVLVTVATAPTAAAMKATTTVPIVFALAADPTGSGFVPSYASSHSNVTGVSSYAGPLTGKRLEILKELAPSIQRVLALVASKEPIAQ